MWHNKIIEASFIVFLYSLSVSMLPRRVRVGEGMCVIMALFPNLCSPWLQTVCMSWMWWLTIADYCWLLYKWCLINGIYILKLSWRGRVGPRRAAVLIMNTDSMQQPINTPLVVPIFHHKCGHRTQETRTQWPTRVCWVEGRIKYLSWKSSFVSFQVQISFYVVWVHLLQHSRHLVCIITFHISQYNNQYCIYKPAFFIPDIWHWVRDTW